MLGSFLFLAQDLYVQPATKNAQDVQALFNITLWIAIVIYVIVQGLLLYMLFRFRKNTKVPKEEGHRGHTTAEVVWTVIPAAILLFLGFLSAGTLVQLDTIPDDGDVDVVVNVTASQFSWTFTYPDGSIGVNSLKIAEGSKVKIDLTATDVIHAFAIPEFAIKLDAVPGKHHYQSFIVPRLAPGETTHSFFIQCMEYCGVGHHLMGPSKMNGNSAPKLIVFPDPGVGGQRFGDPPAPSS